MLFEAAPLAWPDTGKVPAIVAEYVVDQEFPGKAESWFTEMMPDLLHNFVASEDYEVRGAISGIFLGLSSDRLNPHWGKWVSTETLEAIYDVGRSHLEGRHPGAFDN